MANYYDNAAYDFESFAPNRKKAVEKPSGFEPRIVRAPKKRAAESRRPELWKKYARVFAIALVSFVLLGSRIYLQVSLTEKTRTLDNYNTSIKVAQSENVVLNNQLYEIMSLDTVEKKAVNELHMVKSDAAQIEYVSVGVTDNTADGERTDG